MKPRVLVVDDEKNIRRMLTLILEGAGYDVATAESGEEAVAALAHNPALVCLLDVGLPGQDGIETLGQIQNDYPGTGVVMISGQATVQTAVEAARRGAFDFLEKPLDKERVLIAVRNALQVSELGEAVAHNRQSEAKRHILVGDCAAMQTLREQIVKVGPTPATVLITGESGVGKENVARAVHEASTRGEAPFVKVNCAAIPEELIESELFGCVKGAFTGADRTRDGKFLQADTGTLFLDEIGDMSRRVQAKVLRALQEGEIERVGDSKTQRVDVRVLAATNKDLMHEVEEGRFREDLFFRLNVVPLGVPPLRERRDDIAQLARHFLHLYAADNDLPRKELAPDALEALEAMSWRGNIREVRNIIERLAILSNGPTITADDVGLLVPAAESGRPVPSTSGAADGGPSASLEFIRDAGGLVEARRRFERRCIELCLDETGGNVSQAARLLAVERSNLHKKMQAYELVARPPRDAGSDGS